MSLSFKDFLAIVNEDTQADIAKLMSDISLVDTQINTRTTPLMQRKMQLQKLLAIKQKQQQSQQKQAGTQNTMTAGQPNQAPPSSQTTTPGGTGAATPGSAPSLPR